MIINLKNIFNNKKNNYNNLNQEIVQRNRIKKSIFIILCVVSAFVVNIFSLVLYYENKIQVVHVTSILELYGIIVLIFGLFILPYHPSHYGLNFNRWKLNLIIGLTIGFVGMIIMSLIRLHFFINKDIPGYEYDFSFKIIYLYYPFTAFIQETIIKGYFQSYFISVFEGIKYNKIISIIISSIVFAILHMVFGFLFVLLAFIYSILTGLLYEKSRSVLGISIIHYMMGIGFLYFIKGI